ncbi:MAG: G8 domain-containing protein [Planctomycetales bacterium]|nr:G8 domain-containing protein [Planctomycetales bacterium]
MDPIPSDLPVVDSAIAALPQDLLCRVEPDQVHLIAPSQIAQIPSQASFNKWTPDIRKKLDEAQLQQLDTSVISVELISPNQRLLLSDAQIGALAPSQWKFLAVGEISRIPADNFSTLVNTFYLSDTYGFSEAQRNALTASQIQALPIGVNIRLNWMTPQQVGWLSSSQIANVPIDEIHLLHDWQIPYVTPAQFAEMTNLSQFVNFTDEVMAKLTVEQLQALPDKQLAEYMRIEQYMDPPAVYRPGGMGVGSHLMAPIPGTMSFDAYYITNPNDATHVAATGEGAWSDPATWGGNEIPGAGARIYIPEGAVVRFDAQMSEMAQTLRIDGALFFATDQDTEMRVETIVVGGVGKLHIGDEAAPIGDAFTARLLFPTEGRIDTQWDPALVSRGLISRGELRVVGREVTPYAALSVDPMKNDRTLQFQQAPIGWRVGDELVIAGTNPIGADFESEHVTIASIEGNVVTVETGLQYNHDAPDGYGFSVHVANLNRNVQFLADDPSAPAQQRPHIAFTESPNVLVENARVEGFGRTDKSQDVTDPIVVDGVLRSGGENPRARYALHFHHTARDAETPGVLRGNVVIGSPGWGYVIHSSYAELDNNVALDVVGAAFVGEDGNEIGVMSRNLALNARGYDAGLQQGPLARIKAVPIDPQDLSKGYHNLHDFGHNGHGFWLQGPGIALVENIVSGSLSSAYGYFTASDRNKFDAVNLDDPTVAAGKDAVAVSTVPLKQFSGNTSYAAHQGLEIWFSQLYFPGDSTLIDNYTAWNTRRAVQLFYSGNINIRNSTLLGHLDLFSNPNFTSHEGVGVNGLVHDVVLDNLRIEGFITGVTAPVRRDTAIIGGVYRNLQNLKIVKGHDTIRSLEVVEPIAFLPLSPSEIAGRETYNVATINDFEIHDAGTRRIESLFSADDLRVAIGGGDVLRLYFADQTADAIPFPTASYANNLDVAKYVGKSNAELEKAFGIWFNGGPPPSNAFTPANFLALAAYENEPSLQADFDGDGDADGSDFLTWQRAQGNVNASTRLGDANGDNLVNNVDRQIWERAFGLWGLAPQARAPLSASVLNALAATPPTRTAEQDVDVSLEPSLSAAPRERSRAGVRPRRTAFAMVATELPVYLEQ